MPEAPDTIDDAVEALSSPTTQELVDDVGVRDFSAREMAAYAIANGGGGGGGGGVTTQTLTVDLEGPDFEITHEFDCGRVALAVVRFTLLAADGDGETFGQGSGEIGVGFFGLRIARISGSYASPVALLAASSLPEETTSSGFVSEVGGAETTLIGTPRYIRAGASIVDNDSFDTYAGGNSPTAQVRFDLEYL